MLGDDIMDGTRSLIGTLKHATGSAIKGGLMFGAIALGVGVVAAAAGAAFIPGVATLVAETLAGTGTGIAALDGIIAFGGNILDIAVGSAVIGGGAVGITNLIPGKDQGFRLRNLFKRNERSHKREQQTELSPRTPDRGSDIFPSSPNLDSGRDILPAGPVSPSGGGSAGNHTYIDNSRHEYHSQAAESQASAQPQTPQNADDTSRSAADSAAGGTQFGGTVFPPKDRLMDEPNTNPYFKPGKGMDSLQKGNDRSNELGIQR